MDSKNRDANYDLRHQHFLERLLERYGLVLEPGEYEDMLSQIKMRQATLIKALERNACLYSVILKRDDGEGNMRDRRVHVIYVPTNGGELTTVISRNEKKSVRRIKRATEQAWHWSRGKRREKGHQ